MIRTRSALRLTVFLGEGDTWHGRPLYSEILRRAQAAGLAGASVMRGLEGFGARRVMHTSRVFSVSGDLPLTEVVVDEDDTLDVVGVHGWDGLTGLVMVGLFATARVSGHEGLFYGGGWSLLGKQLVAILACGTFSFVLTWLIAKAVDTTIGFRSPDDYQHVPGEDEERAYDFRTVTQITDLTEAAPLRPPPGEEPAGVGADRPAISDAELVEEIRRLIRARGADR